MLLRWRSPPHPLTLLLFWTWWNLGPRPTSPLLLPLALPTLLYFWTLWGLQFRLVHLLLHFLVLLLGLPLVLLYPLCPIPLDPHPAPFLEIVGRWG